MSNEKLENKSKRRLALIGIPIVALTLILGLFTCNFIFGDKYDTTTLLEERDTLDKVAMTELARKTLIVCAPDFEPDESGALSYENYGNVYALTYNSSAEATLAFCKYKLDASITYCSYDGVMETTDVDSTESSDVDDQYWKSLGDAVVDDYLETANRDVYNSIIDDVEFDPENKATIVVIDSGATGDYDRSYNVIDNTSDVTDIVGHGTEMISIIDKHLEKYSGQYEIVPVKIANDKGIGSISALLEAFEYASTLDPTIINLSLTSSSSVNEDLVEHYISKFGHNGVAVVASAGNNGADTAKFVPAKFTSAIVVASSDENGNLREFSNFGDSVDYLVTSDSTSEAAALMSAMMAESWITGEVVSNINSDIIFDTEGVQLENDSSVEFIEVSELWWWCGGSNADQGLGTEGTVHYFGGVSWYDTIWKNEIGQDFCDAGYYKLKKHNYDKVVYYQGANSVWYVCIAGPYKDAACSSKGSNFNGYGWMRVPEIQAALDPCASGHNYASATCTAPQTCTRCGATSGSALGHAWVLDGDVQQYTSCTNNGYRNQKCSRCSAQQFAWTDAYKYENAWGHAWPGDFTYASNNNVSNGIRYKNCTRCSTRLHTQYAVYANVGTGISSVSGTNWYDAGSTVTLTASVRTGYTWSHWGCSGCGGTSAYQTETIYGLDRAHYYTAYATPNQYTYKINPNGGRFSNGVTSVATADPNLIYETSNWYNSGGWIPNRTGYTIQGLYDKSSGGTKVFNASGLCVNGCGYWNNNLYVHAGNLTVYAQWKANTYTVVYNGNGGSGTTASQNCTYDTAFNLRANGFTKNGYEFLGWSLANDNTVDWRAGTSVKNLTSVNGGVVTLYACWRPYVASFAYHPNGGTISASGYSINQYGYVQNASGDPWFHKVAYPNNVKLYDPYTFRLTKNGYKFVNWNTAANYTGTDYYAGSTASSIDKLTTKTYAITAFNNSAIYTQDINVYLFAEWKPRDYKVIYKANGGSGSDVTETWTYDSQHKLYDNFTTHHFTKTGYYIDYWIVENATDIISGKKGLHLNAGAAYDASGNVIATDQTYGDLLCPLQDGRTIVLKAHWAPIKYRVQYNNDSAKTLIATNSNSKGYVVSTKSYTTNFFNYGTSYSINTYNFTRSNKFGESTFLGYGLYDEDKSLTPKYYVAGKSPTDLSNKLKVITATDFKTVKTKEGTLYNTYFAYLNPGSVQTFNVYAVWDDCPGIDPVDIYSTMIGGDGTIAAANTPNSNVRSGKQIEYDLLYYADNVNSLWDRESGTGKKLILDKNHYYISYLSVDEMASQDTVTTYIVNYTIVDARGNKYTVARKLYSGYKANIMIK